MTTFGRGGFSVHHRVSPNCHHARPVVRWCGSSKVVDSVVADVTVHATAAPAKTTDSASRAARPLFSRDTPPIYQNAFVRVILHRNQIWGLVLVA